VAESFPKGKRKEGEPMMRAGRGGRWVEGGGRDGGKGTPPYRTLVGPQHLVSITIMRMRRAPLFLLH